MLVLREIQQWPSRPSPKGKSRRNQSDRQLPNDTPYQTDYSSDCMVRDKITSFPRCPKTRFLAQQSHSSHSSVFRRVCVRVCEWSEW